MFENPRRGRQARNLITNVPKILDLKSSSKQLFSENWRRVPLPDHESVINMHLKNMQIEHFSDTYLCVRLSRPLYYPDGCILNQTN